MSRYVYDCDTEIRAAVEGLRAKGAYDEEILKAITDVANELLAPLMAKTQPDLG